MKWSTRIGAVTGIGIYIHWSFWLLVAWFVVANVLQGQSTADVVRGVALLMAVFVCIFLHELGHALAARRYGIRTSDITILPIGGLARLERMPEDPIQELWVALAGPAVNVLIALVLFAVVVFAFGLQQVAQFEVVTGNLLGFLVALMWINVWLVVFNLIPAFPMDGGRVLRALLGTRFDFMFATHVAASVGQGIAILFAIVGLLVPGMWMLLFIAMFVYLGAGQEAHSASVKSLLRGVPVRAAMVTRFRTLAESDRLPVVLDELLSGYQQDFPVVDEGRVVGVLTRGDLMQALAQGGHTTTVGEIMRRDCTTVEEGEMLEKTFEKMSASNCPAVPVLRGGQLVGVVTLENVGEWMMIHTAMHGRAPRADADTALRPV